MMAASGKSSLSQDEFVELLAGPPQQSPEGQRIRDEMAGRIRAVLDDQRLVSLDTLFTLGDGLTHMAQGAPGGIQLSPPGQSTQGIRVAPPHLYRE